MSGSPKFGDPIKDDFRVFLTLCWSFLGLPPPTPKQIEIAYFLQHGGKKKMIRAFRGLGKSWITAAYVLWRLYREPHLNLMVVSGSQQRAIEFSQFCHKLIMSWDLIAELRPREGQRFSIEAFDVGPAGIAHQPSVKAVGITGTITGSRAHEIIADDIETPKNSATFLLREKLVNLIAEFNAIILPDIGQITYLGTPQTEESIYNGLITKGYDVLTIPARVPKPSDVAAYSGTLTPSVAKLVGEHTGDPTDTRFNDFDLHERELEYGRAGFALQFMLNTKLSDLERFPLKINDLTVMTLTKERGPERVVWANSPELVWKDLQPVGLSGDRYFRPIPQEDIKWVPWESSVMAIDPSGRGKDETAICVVKAIGSTLFLTRIHGYLGGFDEASLKSIAEIAKDEQVNRIVVEENFGGGMFTQLFKPILHKLHKCEVEEIRHNTQKERRICDTLEPVLNQHRLVVDKAVVEHDFQSTEGRGTEEEQRYRLFWQLPRVTRERGALPTDDRLDVLAMAVADHVARMAVSVEKSIEARDWRAMKKELEFFNANAVDTMFTGRSKRPKRHGLGVSKGYRVRGNSRN